MAADFVFVSDSPTAAKYSGKYVHVEDSAPTYWKHETEDIYLFSPAPIRFSYILTDDVAWFNRWYNNEYPLISEITGYFESPTQTGTYTGYGTVEFKTGSMTVFTYLPDIYTVDDLVALGTTNIFAPAYFIMADIDCMSSTLGIGDAANPFTGVIYGNGHELTNVRSYTGSGDERGGLIDYSSGCSIYDLTIYTYIYGDDKCGGLLGCLEVNDQYQCEFKNVHVKPDGAYGNDIGKINSASGGMFGCLRTLEGGGGTILVENCSVDGDIKINTSSQQSAAGIFVGEIESQEAAEHNIIVRNCWASGRIEAHNTVGGFVGLLQADGYGITEQVLIEDCWADSDFFTRPYTSALVNFKMFGGFAGRIACYTYGKGISRVRRCYCTTNMDFAQHYTNASYKSPKSNTGGFAGDVNNRAIIEDCWSYMNLVVTDYWYAHATWGYVWGTFSGFVPTNKWGNDIKNCYCYGTITLPDATIANPYFGFTIQDGGVFNGDYTLRTLNFNNISTFEHTSGDYQLVYYDSTFYLMSTAGYNYLIANTALPLDYYTGAGIPVSNGQNMGDVTFTGHGIYGGQALTLKALVNTETKGKETGGFYSYPQGATIDSVDTIGHTENCISYMETTNVKAGFIDQMGTLDGRCEFDANGCYYDKTLNGGTIPADYSAAITGLETEQFKIEQNLPDLDFNKWVIFGDRPEPRATVKSNRRNNLSRICRV